MSIHRIQTPDGVLVVVTPVADRLLAAGYLVRNEDGSLASAHVDTRTLQQYIAELAVCDFCSETKAPHVIVTPDFPLIEEVLSEGGGWAACDACYALVQANKRTELLRRAVDQAPHGKFTAATIAALHKTFWQSRDDLVEAAGIGAALTDYIEGRVPDLKPTLLARDKRLESVRMLTGLTDDELEALTRGDFTYKQVSKKLSAWHKKYGTDYKGARRLAELLEADRHRPLPPGHIPHWQQALDARFSALNELQRAMKISQPLVSRNPTDLTDPEAVRKLIQQAKVQQQLRNMEFSTDIRLLHMAEAYSFNEETLTAIREAAKSIPHDAPLSSIETPNTGAGWFWFSVPMPVASSPVASDRTAALLWGWDNHESGTAVVRFSAYVVDEKDTSSVMKGKILPSAKWYWSPGMTLHQMMGLAVAKYRQAYGPGGAWEGADNVVGEAATMAVIAELSLFFLAACVWFKQKILISAPGHVERHARKRYVKEHKLKEPPSVRVIALRASYKEPAEPREPSEHGSREYHCRWIVRGHARLQACGPGRADHKLIWIDPYPKGPEDKPLRTREKVYAVIR